MGTSTMNRRALLTGAGAGTAAAIVGAGAAQASENMTGDRCLTSVFPNSEGAFFDFDYYIEKHVPMVLKLYGQSIRRYEIFKPISGGRGEKPAFIAVTQIWIADEEAFAKAGAEHAGKYRADIPKFTNVSPISKFQKNELVAVLES